MMIEPRKRKRWKPAPVGLIAGILVLAGFLLVELDWGFIVLVGLGAFGPGILRERGWLRDKDEFQLEAARRAGYHGFLATGLLAFLLTAYYRRHPDLVAWPGNPVELLLGMAVFFTVFFDLSRVIDDPLRNGAVFVLLFFVGPLLVAGLALLRRKEDQS
jgi:hypothetical protein